MAQVALLVHSDVPNRHTRTESSTAQQKQKQNGSLDPIVVQSSSHRYSSEIDVAAREKVV